MKNKKFLPLVILVGVVALLGILLAVLTLHGEAETAGCWPMTRRCRWTRPRCRALWRTTPT